MISKRPPQTHASRSFYETVVRIAAFFFSVVIYLLLLKFNFLNIFVLMLLVSGLFFYGYLCRKKLALEKDKAALITLDRSYFHIFVDIINETCRGSLLSVIIFVIVNRKFGLLEDDYSLTREASVLIMIMLAYIFVLWFYHRISRQEQESR